jgi:hypothetical protein
MATDVVMNGSTLTTPFSFLFIFLLCISLISGSLASDVNLDATSDPTMASVININETQVLTTEESLSPNIFSPDVLDEKEKSDQNQKNGNNKKFFDDKKDLKLFRWTKEREFRFPIRPPKLRKVSPSSEGLSQKSRIGYASALQTRQTDLNSTIISPIRKVRKVKRKRMDSRPNNQTNYDIFELQSSDESPSIAIFIPKRLSSKNRLTGEIIADNIAQQFNKTRKRIPKLLLPKSLRPAMYSLDGFVPRPSINKITSTEAPVIEKQTKFQSRRQKKLDEINKSQKEQKNRRFGANRNSIEEQNKAKKDDIDVSDSRRRSVITKRKSTQTLQTSDSIQKSTVNKIAKDKRKGIAGKDYPTLSSVPKTDFECKELNNGVYADLETGCQVWHICQNRHKHSFLCPNGTIFNEKNGICDWWYNQDCPKLLKLTDKDDSDMDSIKAKLKTKRHSVHRFA